MNPLVFDSYLVEKIVVDEPNVVVMEQFDLDVLLDLGLDIDELFLVVLS